MVRYFRTPFQTVMAATARQTTDAAGAAAPRAAATHADGAAPRAAASASGETKALVKAVAALDALLAAPDGRSLAEIARETGLSKATAHRLLGGLADAQLVRPLGEGRYALGPRCLVLGAGFLAGVDLRREALPALRELAQRAGETVHLGVLSGTQVVYIEKVDSHHAIRMHSRVGATQPALSTGLGRAILAYAEPELVEAALAAGVQARTPGTVTDPGALRTLLARVRERGVAVDDVENEPGIRCVAAAVLDHAGRPVAAISVSGPEHRVTPQEAARLAPLVRETAERVSRGLGWTGDRLAPIA
jgi:DNA-binding IclR family transcriptional regulator